jgi:hypothetical protein
MPYVTQKPKYFQQRNAVFLQFHIASSLSQDIWLVTVKTNNEMLSSVRGAQKIYCNLKLCIFLITSSEFVQHHCTHIPTCNHQWRHSLFSFTVCDQTLHLQNIHKHKISLLPSCNITYHHNYAHCNTAILLVEMQHSLPF